MLQAQHDLKIKRFSVKRHMVLLNPGSHRWPRLSSGHKAKPKDVCVRKGRRGKVTGVGGDGNETCSIHDSVITKHVIQRLFLYCLKKCRRNTFGQICDLEKKLLNFTLLIGINCRLNTKACSCLCCTLYAFPCVLQNVHTTSLW